MARGTEGPGVLGEAPRDGAALRDLKDKPASAGEVGWRAWEQGDHGASRAKGGQSLKQNLKGEQVEKRNR